MSYHLAAVAQRKAALIARAAVQRDAIAHAAAVWQARTHLVDRGMSWLGKLRAHPVLTGVGIAVLLIFRRASLMRWIGRALMLWRGWHMVQSTLRGRLLR
jgi:YqjK-like protein